MRHSKSTGCTTLDAAEKKLAEFTDPYRTKDKIKILRELTVDELHRVCASLTGEMRILFAIGIYTGLRLGDCATLKWDNVDLVRRFISVIPAKTRRHGTRVKIPIHSTLAAMLAETPAEKRKGEILPQTAKIFAAINVLTENDLRAMRDAIDKRLALFCQ